MNDFTKKHLRKDIEYSYNKNGDIEILISPGFGAGWSTWSSEYSINLAVDKRIIDFFKKYKHDVDIDKVDNFLTSIGYKNVFMSGYYDLIIETVPEGSKFRISEYDGHETLILYAQDEVWEL